MPHKGYKQTQEHKDKGAAARTGRHHGADTIAKMRASCAMKRPDVVAKSRASWTPKRRAKRAALMTGDKNPMKRPEVAAKTAASRTGKYVGDKSPNWLGGLSFLPYAWTFNAELKEEVRRRDRYKCQLCGVPQAECRMALPVHHADYDKKNSDPVNLVALCHSCHSKTNTNRQYWTAFFQAMALKRDLAALDNRTQRGG